MAKTYATPGVYIEEKDAFSNSIFPVAAAIPAFIGYTEKAIGNQKDLTRVPTRISSYEEFVMYFGGPPVTKFSISAGAPYQLAIVESYFTLNSQMKMFFSNGGSDCYIVSVGGYGTGKVKIETLRSGIEPLLKYLEPTMVIIPEATMADDDDAAVYGLYQDVLKHCGVDTRSRFAIMDVRMDRERYNAPDYNMMNDVAEFRSGIGTDNLQWGAAYFPWLETMATAHNEVDLLNIHSDSIGNADQVREISDDMLENGIVSDKDGFNSEELATITEGKVAMVDSTNTATLLGILERALNQEILEGTTKPARANEIKRELFQKIPEVFAAKVTEQVDQLNQGLLATSPIYKKLLADIRKEFNLLPPSGAIAGVYCMVDNSMGVFHSPANVSLASVVKPAIDIDNDAQEKLNLPIDGKAVNAIRSFPGKGTLVWGARTLDGNSQDWRYISVRRTMIYIEQSIKYALEAYAFEPNTAATWSNAKSMIVNFLTNLWQSGAIVGGSPDDAFVVEVGLGSSMTPADIMDGYMRASILVALTRPGEFITVYFEQKMLQQ